MQSIEESILCIFGSILNREVSKDSNFFSLGGDSLEMSDIVYHINQKYHIEIRSKDLLALGGDLETIIEEIQKHIIAT